MELDLKVDNSIISKANELVQQIEVFISENVHRDDFGDVMYEEFEVGMTNFMGLVSASIGKRITISEALGIHKGFWQLNSKYKHHKHVGHEPFFILVGAHDANHFPWTVSKEDLIEFDRKENTFLYRNFRNESDDLPFSEYPIALMLGKIQPDFHCLDKEYEERIGKIRHMIKTNKDKFEIADSIEYLLEDILRDTATSLYECPILKQGIKAAKEAIQIYTNDEYDLPYSHSEMLIKFINYGGLMNHGRIIVEWTEGKNVNTTDVTINGVTMKAIDAICFLDQFIELNRTLTNRFYFNGLDKQDEEQSVYLADAMKSFIKDRKRF